MDEILFYIIINVFLIILIIVQQVLRAKRKDKIIVKSLKIGYYSCFFYSFGVMWFILAIFNFRMFIKYFNEVYSLLIPKYLNNWYDLFGYMNLTDLENMFSANKMHDEYWAVHMYTRKYDNMLTAVTQVLCGIAYLLRGLQLSYDTICPNGIYTKSGNYKWDRIMSYKWSEIERNKRNVEYYNLVCILNNTNSKVSKWFYWEGSKEISIEIKVENKDQVDQFLKKAIKKQGM